ncbi:hypothetical protein N7539_005008 [Penicillium diatomitis]|uniref:Uncharacterized protein n=1 Tax=Penicillium diatomitis TaxID=2819901 RepID=A0A9W9X7C4_9EURO|nr:uncharacterized protein N7539_005008 [Penicillium diatomitis]KAJ5485020.1 hypothetical protein N7539_005008 [Penicillium diatomitis]
MDETLKRPSHSQDGSGIDNGNIEFLECDARLEGGPNQVEWRMLSPSMDSGVPQKVELGKSSELHLWECDLRREPQVSKWERWGDQVECGRWSSGLNRRVP